MAGGNMQLTNQGKQNAFLNFNPTMSFFKKAYRKYTDFAMQKFIITHDGSPDLQLSEPSVFKFKIKRYGDLLMDAYLMVDLPHIWSPIMPPQNPDNSPNVEGSPDWVPYEFKWIENIGAKMIHSIKYNCGNATLQEYSGDYLLASVQRDYSLDKKQLFDEMTGNVPELNDPANCNSRINVYPNAYYYDDNTDPEPSIHGRTLYIPLNGWFGLDASMAFPLVSCQYVELEIVITFRPINELFIIRDVFDVDNNYPYVAPNFNTWYMQFFRFLQKPPDLSLAIPSYVDTRTTWNTNIQLMCTYAFLSNDERYEFATKPQKYLIKQVRKHIQYNMTGTKAYELHSNGLVSNWLYYFQRSDVNLRNEWSNYTNWAYKYIPINVVQAPVNGNYVIYRTNASGQLIQSQIGAGVNPNGVPTGLLITNPYTVLNEKEIMVSMSILLDGEYRESMLPSGVFNYIEKYTRTSGNAPFGLYCYNFCINSNNKDLQPSGAINMTMFNKIVLQFVTIHPPSNPFAQSLVICNPNTKSIIGNNKQTWNVYEYNYNLYLFEEIINVITFESGLVGAEFAI